MSTNLGIAVTPKTRSLSFHVTVWLALGIAIGMAGYAIYQYATISGHTTLDLTLHHTWHVLVLGAMMYLVSWLTLHRILIKPLHTIYIHLYALGAGKLEPLTLNSRVTEIRTIVDGVNLMLRRTEQDLDTEGLSRVQREARELNKAIWELEIADPTAKSLALDKLAALEKSLSALVRNTKLSPVRIVEQPQCLQCVEA